MENIWSAVGAGKARRASRLFGRDGRCLLVAIDLQSVAGEGPTLDVAEQVAAGGPDGMLVTWQIARRYPGAIAGSALVLRVDGGLTLMGRTAPGDVSSLMFGAEQAALIGAEAVVLMVYPGADDETGSLQRLAALVGECEKIGMPVIAESIPGGWEQDIPWDAGNIARAARLCVEVGADAIKTMAPPLIADLPRVVASCEAPLLVLGGPKMASEDDAVEYARDVVAEGATGVAFGRNTWGALDPTAMVRRLYVAVHGRS